MPLEREPTNPEDQCAVAIQKSGATSTVGHVPFNLAPVVSAFLKRSCNKGPVEVTGNSQSGRRLRIRNPVQVSFLWLYIAKLETIVYKQRSDGLLIYDGFCCVQS